MTEVTVGIDIGTTSVKAVAADGDGRVLASCRVPHPVLIPEADRLEHDARRAWRRGPRAALTAVLRAQPGDVQAVSVSSMIPSLTAVDRRGLPVTPGLLYGDARGRVEGAEPGSPITGEFGAFLDWSRDQAPDARGYWPATAVANFALSGQAVIDGGQAGVAFPLWNGPGWDADGVAEHGITVEQLPRIEPTGAPIGYVGDAILASGAVDAMGEQIVAGADNDGDVLVIMGTTLITWLTVSSWVRAPGIWTIPHPAPGKIMMGGPSNAGGLFLNWATKLLGRAHPPADPGRVPVWEPYVRGERTPLHDPYRRAALHRLDLTTEPGGIRRAAFEASGFVVRHHLDLATNAPNAEVVPRRVVATGGGTRVPEWLQALADCTGLPVDVVALPEGGALGAAFVARMAAGLESSMADAGRWARHTRRIEPDPAWAAAVEERYQCFRALAGG
jgi:xylulokinase